MKLNCYLNKIEKAWETQFCAVTFLLETGMPFVAFRGTDESLVGWKEDFNMAFLHPIPSQSYSTKYLNMVTAKWSGDFYVGGHSKGGNLAVYSAMNCVPKVQERIRGIYNMDGPGFRPEILAQCGYENIADKVTKWVPASSLIGMVFEWDHRYRVVHSKVLGLAQHDPYTWLLKDGDFWEKEGIRGAQAKINEAMNEWLLGLEEEKIEVVVNTLYQILQASQAEDLITFAMDWRKSMQRILQAIKEVDGSKRNLLKHTLRDFFQVYAKHRKEEKRVRRNQPRVYPAITHPLSKT